MAISTYVKNGIHTVLNEWSMTPISVCKALNKWQSFGIFITLVIVVELVVNYYLATVAFLQN